jgi:hypothetical protein
MTVVRFAVAVLTLISVAAPARAEVAVAPGVPFTASELVAALALRGAMVDQVVVRAVSPTAVELRTPAGGQRVELGVARGPAAARLVALQLTLSSALPVPVPAPAGATDRASIPRAPDWTFDLTVGGGRGASASDFALAAIRADAIATLGPWRWGAGLGWLHGLAPALDGPTSTTADLAALRAEVGIAAGRLGVLAGPALVGYRVAGASGVAFGAGGELRVQLPGGVRWHTTACAQFDVFFHRILVERDGRPVASTPRVALTALFGIAWGGT